MPRNVVRIVPCLEQVAGIAVQVVEQSAAVAPRDRLGDDFARVLAEMRPAFPDVAQLRPQRWRQGRQPEPQHGAALVKHGKVRFEALQAFLDQFRIARMAAQVALGLEMDIARQPAQAAGEVDLGGRAVEAGHGRFDDDSADPADQAEQRGDQDELSTQGQPHGAFLRA
jgi:hypothetical protein